MDFICQQSDYFQNPNKLPLNELQLEIQSCKKNKKLPKDKDLEKLKDMLNKFYDVKCEKIPALDSRWIQKEHSFHKYQPYFSEVPKEENDLFLERNKIFLSHLKFLLQRNYHQFWNYLIYEPHVRIILDSFLINPVHWYEISYLDEEFLQLYTDIYDRIAQIYLRMLTFKESNTEFMLEANVLKYVEKCQLLTYPKIMSLCLLYNKTCQTLINRLVEIYFCETKVHLYTRELRKILDHSLLVFEMLGGQLCGFEENSVIIPIAVRQRPGKFDPYWVEEVATYLLDTATTLNALFSCCKPAVDMGLKMGIPFRLSYFYNKIYPALYDMLKDRADLPYNWEELRKRIYDHMGIGRSEFVNVFHVFVTHIIDCVIQTLGDNEKQDEYLEQYLKMITTALEDEFFIFDYHNAHHIDVQILTVTDFYPNLDHTRSDYILECLSTLPNLQNLLFKQQESNTQKESEIISVAGSSKECNGFNVPIEEVQQKLTTVEINAMIQSVLDALPHLGDGFILKCLEAYNYNTTEVISSVLDDNLPPHLSDLPRDLIRIPPEPEPEKPILAYKGKKPTHRDASALLNDKSDIQCIKDFVSRISAYDMYDDDYDDRDGDDPTLRFYDRNDEASLYKHMENRFEGYELVSDPSESSSDENDNPQSAERDRRAFCEDPAVLRARREAQYKHSAKGKGHDVVGKPKGQGQDKSVVQNRDKKTVNKSSRANHNRKGGAQWKRSRGMFPS